MDRKLSEKSLISSSIADTLLIGLEFIVLTYSEYKLQTAETHLSHLLVCHIPFPVTAF